MSALARAGRIVAAGACAATALAAAEIACAQAAPRDAERVAAMSAAQAREFTIGEIRALVTVARAGGQHADPLCRAAAVRAGSLAGAAIDAVVQVDKRRERERRAVGVQAAEDPAVQANYQRVAAATLEARQTVAKGMANCPELLAQHR